MSGFEVDARKQWYKAMKDYKSRIYKVHVIAKNLLIRGAARVMLDFFGLKNNIVRTADELVEKV